MSEPDRIATLRARLAEAATRVDECRRAADDLRRTDLPGALGVARWLDQRTAQRRGELVQTQRHLNAALAAERTRA